MTLTENYQRVMKRIANAANKVGRDPQDVRLIGVTKTVPVNRIEEMLVHPIELGENKVQEMLPKIVRLPKAQWHFIGHLQSNKVKHIVDKVKLIHSLDRLSLAKEMQKRAGMLDISVPVLVEVNVAEEKSKFGLLTNEVEDFLNDISRYNRLRVLGFMTMAPYLQNAEEVRYVFRGLAQLRDKMSHHTWNNINLIHLSMGMSNDFEVAVEEGATMVRIGTALFGER